MPLRTNKVRCEPSSTIEGTHAVVELIDRIALAEDIGTDAARKKLMDSLGGVHDSPLTWAFTQYQRADSDRRDAGTPRSADEVLGQFLRSLGDTADHIALAENLHPCWDTKDG